MTPTKVIASVQSTSDHTIVVNNLKTINLLRKVMLLSNTQKQWKILKKSFRKTISHS